MTAREQLIGYLATLFAIVILVVIAAVVSANGHSLEAVGVSAAVTGLIGVIRMPTSRTAPVAATDSGDVTVQAGKPE